jgi:uncharacterized membrane protein
MAATNKPAVLDIIAIGASAGGVNEASPGSQAREAVAAEIALRREQRRQLRQLLEQDRELRAPVTAN